MNNELDAINAAAEVLNNYIAFDDENIVKTVCEAMINYAAQFKAEQKQSAGVYYEQISKDEWFKMRAGERNQLVAGRDLKTNEPVWLRKPQSAITDVDKILMFVDWLVSGNKLDPVSASVVKKYIPIYKNLNQ